MIPRLTSSKPWSVDVWVAECRKEKRRNPKDSNVGVRVKVKDKGRSKGVLGGTWRPQARLPLSDGGLQHLSNDLRRANSSAYKVFSQQLFPSLSAALPFSLEGEPRNLLATQSSPPARCASPPFSVRMCCVGGLTFSHLSHKLRQTCSHVSASRDNFVRLAWRASASQWSTAVTRAVVRRVWSEIAVETESQPAKRARRVPLVRRVVEP